MRTAIQVLHGHGYTDVKKVIDARGKAQRLTVSAWDCKKGMPRSPDGCPAALAGQRRGRTLVIFLSRTYEITGTTARRWVNSEKLQKAIVKEDKTGAFPAGGDYLIEPPDRWKRSGSYRGHKSRGGGTPQRRMKPRRLSVRRWE